MPDIDDKIKSLSYEELLQALNFANENEYSDFYELKDNYEVVKKVNNELKRRELNAVEELNLYTFFQDLDDCIDDNHEKSDDIKEAIDHIIEILDNPD
jgi:hypothetical protein